MGDPWRANRRLYSVHSALVTSGVRSGSGKLLSCRHGKRNGRKAWPINVFYNIKNHRVFHCSLESSLIECDIWLDFVANAFLEAWEAPYRRQHTRASGAGSVTIR